MIRLSVACAAAVLAAGCGAPGQPSLPAPVSATGKLSGADGKPVGPVMLSFAPVGAPYSAVGKVKEDGTFTLTTYEEKPGICKGKYLVYVRAYPTGPEAAKSKTVVAKVPAKYTDDAGTSPLTVEVTQDGQVLDLKLDAK